MMRAAWHVAKSESRLHLRSPSAVKWILANIAAVGATLIFAWPDRNGRAGTLPDTLHWLALVEFGLVLYVALAAPSRLMGPADRPTLAEWVRDAGVSPSAVVCGRALTTVVFCLLGVGLSAPLLTLGALITPLHAGQLLALAGIAAAFICAFALLGEALTTERTPAWRRRLAVGLCFTLLVALEPLFGERLQALAPLSPLQYADTLTRWSGPVAGATSRGPTNVLTPWWSPLLAIPVSFALARWRAGRSLAKSQTKEARVHGA